MDTIGTQTKANTRIGSLSHLLDFTGSTVNQAKNTVNTSKDNLLKEVVLVRLQEGATKNDRLKVQNLLLANIEET